ncbi:MAG: Radical domain protein, partial [Firmicutes bacterium]|nr:Radical domain protein [Bacillota bacterium]
MIHVYSLYGYKLAIDGNSASIHVLDQIVYDMLKDCLVMPLLEEVTDKLKEKYSLDDISEAYAEIVALRDKGMLFSSIESLENAVGSNEMKAGLKALCLHVAHDCNLRCEYCFASKGDYNSGRNLMRREIALKAIDYLVANSAGRRNVEIDFFGGEPLMNFDVVKEVVAYGRQLEKTINKHFYFTITTNCMLLDRDKIEFINEHMDNVVISIDGRREVHDAVRRDAAGGGSYDKIVPRAIELVKKRNGKSYFVRGTF